jgi:hypothetical protein
VRTKRAILDFPFGRVGHTWQFLLDHGQGGAGPFVKVCRKDEVVASTILIWLDRASRYPFLKVRRTYVPNSSIHTDPTKLRLLGTVAVPNRDDASSISAITVQYESHALLWKSPALLRRGPKWHGMAWQIVLIVPDWQGTYLSILYIGPCTRSHRTQGSTDTY